MNENNFILVLEILFLLLKLKMEIFVFGGRKISLCIRFLPTIFVAIIHVVLLLLVLVLLLLVPQPSKLVNLNFGVFFFLGRKLVLSCALLHFYLRVLYPGREYINFVMH